MLPSVGASWVALRLIGQGNISRKQLLLGGVLVGSGIGTMHYTGMAAMQMGPQLRYDPWYFVLSIAAAVTLAMLALWVRYGIRNLFNMGAWGLNLLGGTVMGIAIASMHYIGMAAARFVAPVDTQLETQDISQAMMLALGVAVTAMLITFIVVATNLTLKYKDLSRIAQASETRIRAMMDTAVDGIVTINASGIIESVNTTAENIFGWRGVDIIGQNIKVLIPGLDEVNIWHSLKASEQQRIGTSKEVDALHRDGHYIPVRLALGFVRLSQEVLFVAFVEDIRERKVIEDALKENEAKFRSLISNIPG